MVWPLHGASDGIGGGCRSFGHLFIVINCACAEVENETPARRFHIDRVRPKR